MAGGTGNNILLNLKLQSQQLLQVMTQDLLSNNKSDMATQYANLIAALTADAATCAATTNIDTLQQ